VISSAGTFDQSIVAGSAAIEGPAVRAAQIAVSASLFMASPGVKKDSGAGCVALPRDVAEHNTDAVDMANS